jgi:hypothetical protein
MDSSCSRWQPPLVWQQTPPPEEVKKTEPVMKYGIEVQAGPMDSILLKDYKPESLLGAENHGGEGAVPGDRCPRALQHEPGEGAR